MAPTRAKRAKMTHHDSASIQYSKIPILKPEFIPKFALNNEDDTDSNMEIPILQQNDNTFNYSSCLKDLNLHFVARQYKNITLNIDYF